MIESLFDLLSRNRSWVFFLISPSAFLLPATSSRMTSEARGGAGGASAGRWSSSSVSMGTGGSQNTARGELQGGRHVIPEILGENHTPALLLTAYCGLKETKLPFFLVYVNWKDEKSLLQVICNKQQRIQVPGS